MMFAREVVRSRYRISTQLYLAFGGAVLMTIAAGLVGWFSFDRVGSAQNQVNDESIPEMAAAFEVAQYSSRLVAAAPQLSAADTLADLDIIYSGITESIDALETQLLVLGEAGSRDDRFDTVRSRSSTIIANIDQIRIQQIEAIALASGRAKLSVDLAEIRSDLDGILVPAIDDQLFFTMTGLRDRTTPALPTSEHFSRPELDRYRILAELHTDANIATELLANAFSLSEAASLEPLKERFDAAIARIDRNLDPLQGGPSYDALVLIFARLSDLGNANESGFQLLDRELRLGERQRALLAENQREASDLVTVVDSLVVTALASADDATQASSEAILTGRTLLLAISVISITGAVLLAWLLVGRILLRRLELLSNWMRRMAGGDLEAGVDIGGSDEIADMAAALEVFRRHALEVQRLNLVERLAEDLQQKNDQLEVALSDLENAQDQIVAQQKLASLGELTAGVAHEIRNPLNFIKNFSESSAELLTELRETIDDEGMEADERRELIVEVSTDLTENLARIINHGDRANGIVRDMLLMSRESGDIQSTDINTLLDEHSRLAYHSARATDVDFQLDLRPNFDESLEPMEVVPQDLGRVFLNMVGNACYATNEKQVAARAAGDEYSPTLDLITRRAGEMVEVVIRDNGDGMPPEVIEKIFNPFFTTKPTDQGTGLGLAISNDIVRQHGGTIRVTSEPGQFTEMVVSLPLAPVIGQSEPADPAAEPAAGAAAEANV